MKPSQTFTYTRTYSRWREEDKRREFYPESVKRTMDFFQSELGKDIVTPHFYRLGTQYLNEMWSMCSMRAMWAAGEAGHKNNITLYNCAYLVVNDIQAFCEILYVLMCSTGAGFSLERCYFGELPPINVNPTGKTVHVVVEDTKEGWATSFGDVLRALWRGDNFTLETSKVRKKGERLLTMGGRASGPEPLVDLFNFCRTLIEGKRKLKQTRMQSIDGLDIANKTAEIVVVGGVRRSSEITLSDLDDLQIARAKFGEFWNANPHRSMSNNSTAYNSKPDVVTFTEEFLNMIKSGTGERGIFNREGARKQMMASGRRKDYEHIGTNPCGEIILRDMQFCNLSEVVARSTDTLETLRNKVKVAAMFGAWQASFTKFPYLRPQWKKNCEEERLLGVSITGIMDNPVLSFVNDKMKRWLGELKGIAIGETERWCRKLDINMSAAITTVKPSGTVSQLVDCASGIHQRYASHYIRRYRISSNDPLFRMLKDQGVPYNPETGQDEHSANTMVLDFPYAAPDGAKTRHDFTGMQQLEHWKVVKEFWTEHNPSITVYVGKDEWLETAAWCYKNFDDLCGVSFLPKDDHVYQLAPYEEITKTQHDALLSKFPKIDYSKLSQYEQEDNTEGNKQFGCVGDKCEI